MGDNLGIKYSLTYSFSRGVRRNWFKADKTFKRYGSDNMTYRRLYEILSKHFNGGTPFLNDYFERQIHFRLGGEFRDMAASLNSSLEKHLAEIRDSYLYKKSGGIDKRSRGYKLFTALSNWTAIECKDKAKNFSDLVKEDVKQCLMTGQISFDFSLDHATVMEREEVGLPGYPEFYASGQLIDHITIYFKVALDGSI